MTTFCPYDCLNSSWHALYLACFLWGSDMFLVKCYHSSLTLSHNSCTLLGGVLYWWSWHLRCSQRCSMGFRSGDWDGQDITWISLSSNHLLAFLEVYLDHCPAESNTLPPPSSKLSTKLFSKISQHFAASVFPLTSMNFPTPFDPIQPHIIRLSPPSCFTVGVVVLSDIGSSLSFHTYPFPSDPIQLIFVLSDHKTFWSPLQSSFHDSVQTLTSSAEDITLPHLFRAESVWTPSCPCGLCTE